MKIIEPYDYQQKAIDIQLKQNLLLDIDCGLGKTFIFTESTIAVDKLPLIYVTRKTAKLQTQIFIKEQYNIDAQLLNPKTDKIESSVVIVHYEEILKYFRLLILLQAKSLVGDESHLFSNPNTKRSKAIKSLATSIDNIIIGSGTPTNKMYDNLFDPLKLWHQAFVLGDNFISTIPYGKFRNTFLQYKTESSDYTGKVWPVIVGLKEENKERYKKLLNQFVYSIKKTSVGHIPPAQVKMNITLSSKQRSFYNRVKKDSAKDIVILLGDRKVPVLSTMSRNNLLQKMASFPPNIRSSKMEWFQEFYEDNKNETFLLVADYILSVDQILLGLKGLGINNSDIAVIFDGKNTLGDRQPKFVVGTIKSFAGSLDLHWINNLVFFEMVWSRIDMVQVRDRIDRGLNLNKSHKAIYFLIGEDTIDNIMFENYIQNWDEETLRLKILQWCIKNGE